MPPLRERREDIPVEPDWQSTGNVHPIVDLGAKVRYHRLVLADTLPEARAAQLDAQRRLGPTGRFHTACLMSQSIRELAINRIRKHHPNLDERGLLAHLMRELYGFRGDTE